MRRRWSWLLIAAALAVGAPAARADDTKPKDVAKKAPATPRPLDAKRLGAFEESRESLRRFEVAAVTHAEKVTKAGKERDELIETLLVAVVERRAQLAAYAEEAALATRAPQLRAEGLVLAAGLNMDMFDTVSRMAEARGLDPAETDAAQARQAMIRLWKRVVDEIPQYSGLGVLLDDLSQAYYDLGDYEQAKRALQRLLCANRESELAAAADAVDNAEDGLKARVYAQSVGVEDYAGCVPRQADRELVDDAWLRLAYLHRTVGGQHKLAVSAYEQVADDPSSPGYFVALQEQAASFVENGQLLDAIPPLDALIEFLDRSAEEASEEDESLAPIRAEAIQRIATILAQLWRDSAVPDPDASLNLGLIYFRGRKQQSHVRVIFEELGAALRRFGAFDQAVPVWRYVLSTWPVDPRAPIVHDRIVSLLVEKGDQRTADEERNKLIAAFGPDSVWRKSNATNKVAVRDADELAAETMFTLASSLYRRAIIQLSTSKVADTALLDEAIAMNRRVVDRFPRSKRGYEASYQLGEVLFLRGRFVDAAQRFRRVRDQDPGGRYYADATRRMVSAYERAADKAEAEGSLVRPQMPTKQALAANAAKPVALPPLLRELQKAYDAHAEVAAGENETASLAYKAALIDLTHFRIEEASKRLDGVVTDHCQSPIAKAAAERLAEISEARGERSLRTAAQNLLNRACGDSRPIQLARQARVRQAIADGERLVKQGRPLEAGRRIYAAHADTPPSDPLYDDTLYRAAEAFAAASRGEVALELLAAFESQPELHKSELYAPALWLTARTYEQAFDDEPAVDAYLRLAQLGQETKYKAAAGFDLPARATEALWKAAELRELDRVFYDRGPGDPGAATLFKRFAVASKSNRELASEAYLRAAAVLQAAGDSAAVERTYAEWSKDIGKHKSVLRFHVRFNHLVASARLVAGDRRGASRAFEEVIKAYDAAGSRPGSEEAVLAAEAQFWRAEDLYHRGLEQQEFRWPENGEEKELAKRVEVLGNAADEAEKAFNKVISFDTEWSIAASLRVGDVYLDVANKFISAPMPSSVSKTLAADVETFAQMVTDAVASVTAEAGEKWRKSVKLAKDRNTVNMWSKLAQQRLNTHIDASKFSVLREELIVSEDTP